MTMYVVEIYVICWIVLLSYKLLSLVKIFHLEISSSLFAQTFHANIHFINIIILTDYITQLFAQATTSSEGELLRSCLILARQAALEGAHIHHPYEQWFRVRYFPSTKLSWSV